jgi:hypothetical protein
MQLKILAIGFLCSLGIANNAYCAGVASFVYNMRFVETGASRSSGQGKHPFIASTTPAGQWRRKRDGTRETVYGDLSVFAYTIENFYARVDLAVARLTQRMKGVHTEHTQMDDLLFSGGYSYSPYQNITLTLSGLVGVPTHKNRILEIFQFGAGQFAAGVLVNGSFDYSGNHSHIIKAAARVVHFFPRQTPFKVLNKVQLFNFTIGNLTDLLIEYEKNWDNHKFEVGYNPTLLLGSRIHPNLDDVDEITPFIRSNFYGVYTYAFSLWDLPNALSLGFSGSFDHKPHKVGYKDIITAWITWGVRF